MNSRPLTVSLYAALAVATYLSWTILRFDEAMTRLPYAIASAVVGVLVLRGVWHGNRSVWMWAVLMNGLALIRTTGAWLSVGPPVETSIYFVLTALKLGLLLHVDTRSWMVSRPARTEAA